LGFSVHNACLYAITRTMMDGTIQVMKFGITRENARYSSRLGLQEYARRPQSQINKLNRSHGGGYRYEIIENNASTDRVLMLERKYTEWGRRSIPGGLPLDRTGR